MKDRLNSLRERWTGRHPSWLVLSLRILLRLTCPVYLAAVSIRNAIFDFGIRRPYRCAVPVISIGNLSVGGTGKTPAVSWIVGWLQRHGLLVVVLSRGYGRLADGRNDEAMELEMKLPGVPHLQHWDRIETAKRAVLDYHAQAIVLDDGFQHRRLARNLDIVLLDATDSPCAQWLLPAGLRREPMSSLQRADVVLITRSDQVEPQNLDQLVQQVKRANRDAVCIRSNHRPEELLGFPDRQAPLKELLNASVLAFCAIGNPPAFFRTLESLGAVIAGQRTWPDHHAFSSADMDWLTQWTLQHPHAKLVCTVKDWVKIRRATIGACELWALKIGLEILDDDGALHKLMTTTVGGPTKPD